MMRFGIIAKDFSDPEALASETRFVKGIFLIRERPAHNHDRALSK